MKNSGYAILFYLLIFLYLFFFTLNCNYVEGDDASTILYHLCGRNSEIQKPYAAYNSGLDFVLAHSGLQTEEALRNFTFMLSFISGFLALALLAIFLETLLKDSNSIAPKTRLVFYLLLPFILPDILFHSLIVNPSNISLVFLLLSLIWFIRFLKNERNSYLILSMVLFAISIPFRWTMLTALPLYVGLFLYFHPLQHYSKSIYRLLFKIMAANLGGLILALCLINITGYDLSAMRDTITGTTEYIEKSEVSLLAMLASGTAFLTPALLLLVSFSVFKIRKENASNGKAMWRISGFLLLSISPFILLGFYPLYKYMITLLPIILLLCLFGFSYVMQSRWLKVGFVMVLTLPWIVGIQIDAKGTFCGPGFELNTDKNLTSKSASSSGNNPDTRVEIEKVRPAFDSGFYMPMPEGPRPMYGYLYTIFGGDWKNQIAIFTNEREQLFEFWTHNKQASYFQDRLSSYFSCDLYRYGFKTTTNFVLKDQRLERIFIKNQDTIALEIVPENDKVAWLTGYAKVVHKPIIYRSSYSNDILKLQAQQQENIKILGPFTAIIEK